MSILIITSSLDMDVYWYENDLLSNLNFHVNHMESVVWNTKISCLSLTKNSIAENFLFMLHDYSFMQHFYLPCYAIWALNIEEKKSLREIIWNTSFY